MVKKYLASATWNMPDVGEVFFRRNLKAKRLIITIRPQTGVRVTVPGLLSFESAKSFVEQKKGWLQEKLSELPKSSGSLSNESNYRTREHALRFLPNSTKKIGVIITNGEINVNYPDTLQANDALVQEAAQKAIELAYRKESLELLPKRVEYLASKHGFTYKDLRIKNIKSRWGSCSSSNNINLSIYLMKLPDDLIDYIILHELTHTVHKNHGVTFWNHLNKLTGNAKALSARVRKYRTGI